MSKLHVDLDFTVYKVFQHTMYKLDQRKPNSSILQDSRTNLFYIIITLVTEIYEKSIHL
jgi:hypothetical protein